MSQNDFVIANASGATVRADINSALAALASLSSGAAAPGTTYANQWWHDDTNDILKIRDEANTAWINAFSKVGTTWIPYNSGSLLGTMANLAYTAIAQNLTLSAKHIAMATTAVASGSPDFAASGNTVTLSGTAAANTLGTVQAGFIGIVHYGIAITLTHNATSRILPTGANIVTAVGDVELVLSLGSGNWRTISYMRADGTPVGGGAAATQAQQEAASLTTVFTTPGRQHFHPGHPKCWNTVSVSGGVPTNDTSYNITSITDNGAGRLLITIATDFSSADWSYSALSEATGVGAMFSVNVRNGTQAAGSIEIESYNNTPAAADPSSYSFQGFGDHA